jgi:hypothetical protein
VEEFLRSRAMAFCSVLCLSFAVFLFAADTISGTWTGEWGPNTFERNQVVAQLKYDGKAVTGTFNSGFTSVMISKGTFNEKTGVIHLEAEGRGRDGSRNHYVIDGKLVKGTMTGTWKYEKANGDFKISMQ